MINLQSPEFNISSGVDQLTIDAGFYKYCEPPKLELGRHPILCTPLTADLTSLNIIKQNTGSITSYWQNYEATIPLDASTGPPDAIKKGGLYYVKSSFQDQNCFQTKSIDVFIQTCQTKVKGKVYLEGFWNGTNMRTDLLNKNLLPKSQPFNSEPWNYFGTEKAINFPLNVTDWILLVIRTEDGRVFDKKPAFVRNDGVLIDIFGAEGVSVGNYSNGFRASIHSKNHLGVMTFNSATSNVFMDLTKDPASVIGVNQLKQIGTNWFLHAGDLDGNGIINSLDFNKWKTKAATVNQYLPADIDGNGIVNNLDYNLWIKNRSKVGVNQIRGF